MQRESQMKILVTGATGYLGRYLVPKLHKRGHRIRILVRKTSDISVFTNITGIEFFYGDISIEETLKGIEENIDQVYHLAVLGHLDKNADDQDYLNVNVKGILNLLKRFTETKLKNFLFATSSAALGAIPGRQITENDFKAPVTSYGMSKYKAELFLKEFCNKNLIPYVMVRLTHVYGPGENRDLFKIIKMMKKGIFPQVGIYPNLYPAVYVDDAINGLILAMERGRNMETYIISDTNSHDLREIRKLVKKYLGIKNRFYPFVPKYPLLIFFLILDMITIFTGIKFPATHKNISFITAGRRFCIKKAQKELGYYPSVSLEQGLKNSFDFYTKEGLS